MSAADDRGGKERLEELGWSREVKSSQLLPEIWRRGIAIKAEVMISHDAACFYFIADEEGTLYWVSAEEMRAVLKRIEELRAGDAE